MKFSYPHITNFDLHYSPTHYLNHSKSDQSTKVLTSRYTKIGLNKHKNGFTWKDMQRNINPSTWHATHKRKTLMRTKDETLREKIWFVWFELRYLRQILPFFVPIATFFYKFWSISEVTMEWVFIYKIFMYQVMIKKKKLWKKQNKRKVLR